jgi:hypothetical protein
MFQGLENATDAKALNFSEPARGYVAAIKRGVSATFLIA